MINVVSIRKPHPGARKSGNIPSSPCCTQKLFQTLPIIGDGDHAKITLPGDMMSDENPYPGYIRHNPILVG